MRRLFGLDRTAPAPTATRAGQALNPLTIPNMVGFARLAALPVFLYLALDSGDGRTASAAILFWLISAGDYLDGFLARVTGQYSRLGALLDPVVDRLTILSGAVVCWHFELLPRWALVVLALRELLTVVLAELALRRGIDLEINWLGRVAVFPVMASIFFAMVFEGWVPKALLIFGLALGLLATALYARIGWRELRRPRPATQPPAHSP